MIQALTQKTKYIISICAIIIAILSLFVTVYESYQQRRHDRLSVKPVLQVIFSTENNWEGFKLKSSGLGPAVISWIEVFVDGKLVHGWQEAMERLNLSIPERHSINAVYSKDVLRPNETVNLFFVDNSKNMNDLRKNNKRIRINICYCSFYDECWLASNDINLNNSYKCSQSTAKNFNSYLEL